MDFKKVRLISFDLDGTLLNLNSEISSTTATVLKEAAQKGILLVPNSGRSVYCVKPLFEDKGIKVSYIIGCNGAQIDDVENNVVIDKHVFAKQQKEKISSLIRRFKDSVTYVIENYYYYQNKGLRNPVNKITMNENDLANEIDVSIHKDGIEVTLEKYDLLKVVFRSLVPGARSEFIEEVKKVDDISITSSTPFNCEVVAGITSKGSALKKLCKHLNIAEDEVIVFGDSYNDMTMFNSSFYKVAVKNAVPELKRKADEVCNFHYEDGVAKFIQKNIL